MHKEKTVRINFVGNHGKKQTSNKPLSLMGIGAYVMALVFFVGVTVGTLPNKENNYRNLLSTARAVPQPIKNFRFYEGEISDFFSEGYKLGSVFAMVKEGKKLESDFNFAEYVVVNRGANYFCPSALDILYLSAEFKKRAALSPNDKEYGEKSKKAIKTIMALSKSKNNHSLAFTSIPYREFFKDSEWTKGDTWNYKDHSPVPQLTANKGMPKKNGKQFSFKINFADGKVREFRPNEPFLALVPNVEESISEDLPSLRPEEALPFALMYYSKFYNKETGKWVDIEELKQQIFIQAATYAGIEIKPEQIEIRGGGKKTRFVYNGPVGNNRTYVYREKKGSDGKLEIVAISVPIVNHRKELLMYASLDPGQAIIIPISRLLKFEDDDMLLANNGAIFSFNDVLEEMAIAQDNTRAKVVSLYGERKTNLTAMGTSALVVNTKRLGIIADTIIGNSNTTNKSLNKLKSFIDQTLPYGTDNKRPDVGYADIQMTPLNTFINSYADCEDHGISYSSLVFSANHPSISKINKYIGLMSSFYFKDEEVVGHITSLVMMPGRTVKTDPFPDHILAPIEGRNIPFYHVEATGVVSDPQGVVRMQRNAFEPNIANIFSGQGENRVIYMAGLSEFKHFPDGFTPDI